MYLGPVAPWSVPSEPTLEDLETRWINESGGETLQEFVQRVQSRVPPDSGDVLCRGADDVERALMWLFFGTIGVVCVLGMWLAGAVVWAAILDLVRWVR